METEGGGVDNRPPIDDDNLPVEAMDTQEGNYVCRFLMDSFYFAHHMRVPHFFQWSTYSRDQFV